MSKTLWAWKWGGGDEDVLFLNDDPVKVWDEYGEQITIVRWELDDVE